MFPIFKKSIVEFQDFLKKLNYIMKDNSGTHDKNLGASYLV